MNIQSTPTLLRRLEKYIVQSLVISRSATRSYKITLLAVAIIVFLLSWFVMQVSLVGQTELSILVAKSLVETVNFIFFCHYFVRSYLKINFVNRHLPLRRVSSLLLFLLFTALISFFISLGFNKIDYFSPLDFKIIEFIGDQGNIDTSFPTAISWIMGIGLKFSGFIIWSIFYVFWHSHRSKKQLQKQMHQAQIQQLTNQLSPHFLFNTLNSIRALIYENKDKAADTVTQLSELFRTHLQAHLSAQATLEEELQVSQRYLAIEQIRLEERLQVTLQIDQNLYQQKLPTLTLLTLIENATKHGISPNVEPGYINITAGKIDQKHWFLSVVNSVGLNIATEGTNTGLINVETRLKLMFADSAIIKQQHTEKEFLIRLELPYV